MYILGTEIKLNQYELIFLGKFGSILMSKKSIQINLDELPAEILKPIRIIAIFIWNNFKITLSISILASEKSVSNRFKQKPMQQIKKMVNKKQIKI